MDQQLVLVCLLVGTGKKENPFVVAAGATDLVGQVKQVILKEKPRTFESIEADELVLYRCRNQDPLDLNILQKLEKPGAQVVLQMHVGGLVEEMTVFSKLRKYFEVPPEDERIHVLVKLPLQAVPKVAAARAARGITMDKKLTAKQLLLDDDKDKAAAMSSTSLAARQAAALSVAQSPSATMALQEPKKRGAGKRLTDKERMEILNVIDSGAKITHVDLALRYGISESAIRKLRKNKGEVQKRYLLGNKHVRDLRQRGSKLGNAAFEDELYRLIFEMQTHESRLSSTFVRKKALEIAPKYNMVSFKASAGWYRRFCSRYHLNANTGALHLQSLVDDSDDPSSMMQQNLMQMHIESMNHAHLHAHHHMTVHDVVGDDMADATADVAETII
ncbi:hypothetical protein DYB25_003935 [Aphanomyces astaci]|uniref:HTH CENPB-type domain-containing protein n=2 Tax=Aphanomyces astaci TaxID=112090 RepID=A0A397BNF9_APHAT|nr:hypothetical protein DYB25_003935 [Aphanomyces astaci]RHY22966.1 hypothetical protein DYB36_012037 [Aphanomyces astaci]RHY50099.1 hypothetical protein DYB38_001281 [Aphanomyces astaci]RHY74437.1 hypothetical protein DYB30_004989 [Aphanomyces astaci]RHY74538.1 hypothetical protein DYB34_004542 [Aphanomyces astaci]